jgi:NAD(P)-dependent dehydrogenase (short-subunit alcohol dehydrogenase family)
MLDQRIALVTGAACHSGYAIAAELLRLGATVYVSDCEAAKVAAAVERLGPRARAAPADLSVPRQIQAMMDRLLQEAGRVDILVNTACQHGIGPSFIETPLEMLDHVLAVNVRGMYLLSQLAARSMVARGGGCIVNISSNTARRAIRNRSTYIASKGAIDALTRAMAIELAPRGVRVNAVSPGYIRTSRWDEISDEHRRRRRKNVPLGREAECDEIARAVAFLCTPAASAITGANLVVDGGVTAQLVPDDVEV